jgi:spore coat protein U-like protein
VSASDFGNEIFALFHNKQYMLLTLGFGCGMGGAYAVATDINSLFAEAMAKDSDIGVLGLFFSLFASLGVLLVGVLLTARPKWRETHRLSVGMSAVACVAMLGNVIGVASQATGLIFLCTLIYGFSVTALNASCLEFGQFVSNGSEFVVNGSMMAAVQLFGIFLTATTGMITAPDDRRKGDTGATIGALFFLMFTQTVATGLIWASSKVLPVDGNNGGAGGVARRRVSSTNKTVSLIDNEETVTAVADVAVHAADGASEGVDVL